MADDAEDKGLRELCGACKGYWDRKHGKCSRIAAYGTTCRDLPSAAPAVWRRLSLGQQQGLARRQALQGHQSRRRLPRSPCAP